MVDTFNPARALCTFTLFWQYVRIGGLGMLALRITGSVPGAATHRQQEAACKKGILKQNTAMLDLKNKVMVTLLTFLIYIYW
jgi:hypothetical protein